MSTCPLCSSAATKWITIEGFSIDECCGCHHRFIAQGIGSTHIAKVYGDAYFDAGGAGYNDYLGQEKLLQSRGLMYANLVSRLTGSKGVVLDVGAAAGFLMEGWESAGWQSIGVDPNNSMAKVAIGRGMKVHCGTFESLAIADSNSMDCVAMVQVISHLINPIQAIEKAYALLRPGGTLLVETWNRGSVIARILGHGWHEYAPPSVLHWFTPKSMNLAAQSKGFQLIRSRHVLRSINAGHAKSVLQYASSKSRIYSCARLMLHFVPDAVNVPYPGDDLFWSLYRKPPK